MSAAEPLPWQDSQWQQVLATFEAGALPHALLITGPRHTGKNRFARSLCELLLCDAPTAGHSCGDCRACALLAAGSHGDFRRLEPEKKSRWIKIDQVRAALDFTFKTAAFGRRKVLLITPAETLNINAANALLKCLEEPPAETHIVLVCHRLQGLPATIRSRCQLLKLPSPQPQAAKAWLAAQIGDVEAETALAAADGRPLLGLQLHRDGLAERAAQQYAVLDALLAGRVGAAEAAGIIACDDFPETLALLAAYLQRRVRDWVQADPGDERARRAFKLLDELMELRAATARGSNPNPDLVLDTVLARMARVGDA